MQEELEVLFVQLDKAKGRATGTLGKGELGDALKAFFRVGQPGGKSEERHDELMQVRSYMHSPLSLCLPFVYGSLLLVLHSSSVVSFCGTCLAWFLADAVFAGLQASAGC